MEWEAGRAAPAGRVDNNCLNDCRTFRMRSGEGWGAAMRGEKRQ